MNVLVAIDSFKGSLSSYELGNEIEKGLKQIYPEAKVLKIPIADGGEGTVDALVEGTNGEFIKVKVKDPLMREIEAKYGIMGDGTAIIEMAQASGLPLLSLEERNPLKTTTYGTGEMIKDAISKGCREFILGIGGSATNDAGVGMFRALGYRFFNEKGEEIFGGGEILSQIAKIDTENVIKELKECKFMVACDVDNPFYGPKGAAEIYSRQKGASEEMVKILDKGLKDFSEILKKSFGKEISEVKGAGAAGGLGGGLMAFVDAKLLPGIDIVLDKVELNKKLENIDFVITGEGKLDHQTAMGKAPVGVAKRAKKFDIPVIAIAGGVTDEAVETHSKGIDSYFSIINYPISLKEAIKKEVAQKFVRQNIEEIFRLIKVCEKRFRR